jgi:hypothetical protein
MSENWYAIHAASLAQLQGEIGPDCPTFVWAGSTYNALPGGASRKKDLIVGGWKLDSDLSITCLIAQFNATSPQALRQAMINTELDYLFDRYKIKSVTIAPGGLQIRIECEDLFQQAG